MPRNERGELGATAEKQTDELVSAGHSAGESPEKIGLREEGMPGAGVCAADALLPQHFTDVTKPVPTP